MRKENVFLDLKKLSKEQLNYLKEIANMQFMKDDCLFAFDKKYQQWYFTDNYDDREEISFEKVRSLINWVETKETHPVKDSNVHFIIRGFEDKGNCGYFDGELYWNKGEAYAKEIVSHFQYVQPISYYN